MQKLFYEVGSLDKRCYDEFALSEDILMEHASNGIASYIRQNFAKNSKVLIVCGVGNNGADGMACARLLHVDYDVRVFYVGEPKSEMAILQDKRLHAIGVKRAIYLDDCDVLVDAIYGTGFRGELNSEVKAVMQTIDKLSAFKIACDIPSGLKLNGECCDDTFVADISLTMGALKISMFSDRAKDFVGKMQVLDLGISREIYELPSKWQLLDMDDMKLPFREQEDTHKGSYGHLAVLCGEKSGASIISGLSALRFGSGLVTLVGYENPPSNMPYTLMYSSHKPTNSTALACGMGLGEDISDKEFGEFLDNSLPMIVDADIFHSPKVLEILKRENIVITPHPKEFISLLKLTNLADIGIAELQNDRFKYCEIFCKIYPHVTLLLKGANVIICQNNSFFINPHGSSALAKAGSGDVLSGLVGALLAQGHTALKSAINASLAHTKLVQNYKGTGFSLIPDDLIAGISKL